MHVVEKRTRSFGVVTFSLEIRKQGCLLGNKRLGSRNMTVGLGELLLLGLLL